MQKSRTTKTTGEITSKQDSKKDHSVSNGDEQRSIVQPEKKSKVSELASSDKLNQMAVEIEKQRQRAVKDEWVRSTAAYLKRFGYDVFKQEVSSLKHAPRAVIKYFVPKYLQSKFETELRLNDSMLTREKLLSIIIALQNTKGLPGHIIETGVYKGELSRLICLTISKLKLLEKKFKFFGFDTFSGFNPASMTKLETSFLGEAFKDTSIEAVREKLREFDFCKIYKGEFPYEITEQIKNAKFKFVHIDTDTKKSIADSLKFFENKMVSGGIIIIDDFMSQKSNGVMPTVARFLRGNEKFIITMGPTDQVILIRQKLKGRH